MRLFHSILLSMVSGCALQPASPADLAGGRAGGKADGVSLGISAQLVSAGPSSTCAVVPNQGLLCWGDNTDGQLGDGTRRANNGPVPVIGAPSEVRHLSVGRSTSCAVTTSGELYCWGAGLPVQIDEANADIDGRALNVTASATRISDVRVSTDAPGRTIAVAARHACFIDDGGQVACFGGGFSGALGDGTTTDRATPARVDGLGPAVDIDAWSYSTCAALEDGSAWCWGGEMGQRPSRIEGVADVAQVDVGQGSACALTRSGEVYCWGSNYYGQLGFDTGSAPTFGMPNLGATRVENLGEATAVAVGDSHACVTLAVGDVVCFGANHQAQLGVPGLALGTYSQGRTPIDPEPPVWTLPFTAGQIEAIRLEDQAFRAGYRAHYELTYGHTYDERVHQPNVDRLPVPNLVSPEVVTAGQWVTCALTGSEVRCWGGGPRGDGTRRGQSISSLGRRLFSFDTTPSVVAPMPAGCAETSTQDMFDWAGDNGSRPSASDLGSARDDGEYERLNGLVEPRGLGIARVSGNVYPSREVDWYKMRLVDYATFSSLDPRIELNGNVQVCAYYEADATWDTTVTCGEGSSAHEIAVPLDNGSETVLRGCCQRGNVALGVDAHGTSDESGQLWIDVEDARGACGGYSLSMTF